MASRKRKRSGSSDANNRPAQREKPNDSDDKELLASFGIFEGALCDLLSAASAVTGLRDALGDQKANFVAALQSMVEAGDLPWVSEADSGIEESGPEKGPPEDVPAAAALLSMPIRAAAPSERVYSSAQLTNEFATGRETLINIRDRYRGTSPDPRSLRKFANITGLPFVEEKWPPPLPVIQNEAFRRQVFTLDTPQNNGDPNAHYQRLEFLGDAYLEIVVTRILFDRFPGIREGPLTRMRQNMVANRVLANYGAIYKFPEMIKEISKDASINWKLLADCFEAYIAAVALSDPSNGLETLMKWLSELYEPRLHGLEGKPFYKERLIHRPRAKEHGVRMPGGRPVGSLQSRPVGNSRRVISRARSRPPLPMDDRSTRRRVVQYPTGPPIVIEDSDEEGEEWEEIPIGDKENQNSAGAPIDRSAKHKLEELVTADGVSLDYEWMGGPDGIDSVEGIDDDLEGWKVTIMLTGWGCVKRPIGTGWGANESCVSPPYTYST